MLNAQKRGHEIGYHSITHPHLPQVSKDAFVRETVSSINRFRQGGIELSTFAYPYAEYEPWMNGELSKSYKVLRGMSAFLPAYTSSEMKSGFVDAVCVDFYMYELFTKGIDFYGHVDRILSTAKKTKTYTLIALHKIIPNAAATGDQMTDISVAISPERIEYILKKAQELGLKFYTYKDFQ
jgi:peptidoglycan/xylan/chitin deacetylase (PgdA/CDA1 family)